jgi:hypothetical protein
MTAPRIQWVHGCRGHRIDLLDPTPERALLLSREDIAATLARLCRFGGRLRADVDHYSVAQHCVWVSFAVPSEHALAGLLHDCSEALLGDVPTPLKRLLPEFRALEREWQSVLLPRFGLPSDLPQCVHNADFIALMTERRDLLVPGQDDWEVECPADAMPIIPWPAYRARVLFLRRWAELDP